MNNILIIEDDKELSNLLSELLQIEGFQCQQAFDGESGLTTARTQKFDIILLDIMLPKLNGLELLKHLRINNNTPVLMLTAKGGDIDKVVGLEVGADDYLAKPFNDRELIARIKALLRRTSVAIDHPTQFSPVLEHDDISLDNARQEVICQKNSIELTATEFSLLNELIRDKGTVLTKEHLSLQVLGKKLMPFDRSIDMHLSNLRKKLPERTDSRPRIKTVRGKGYLWINQ
ncbi:response regulator [Paraferrimonas sp. SM1919]|uniref:response regulator n=1 Tax=Paraferrimonas sp. SM1919 TaxID=2662263 RepID=UPI0013D45BE6|nr:response regulator [Paraferrimonas sp. SM1919]